MRSCRSSTGTQLRRRLVLRGSLGVVLRPTSLTCLDSIRPKRANCVSSATGKAPIRDHSRLRRSFIVSRVQIGWKTLPDRQKECGNVNLRMMLAVARSVLLQVGFQGVIWLNVEGSGGVATWQLFTGQDSGTERAQFLNLRHLGWYIALQSPTGCIADAVDTLRWNSIQAYQRGWEHQSKG